jgi:hypothetical protein
MLIFAAVGFGVVGFLDDYLKVRNRRSLGLSKSQKFLGTGVVSVIFGVIVSHYSGVTGTAGPRRTGRTGSRGGRMAGTQSSPGRRHAAAYRAWFRWFTTTPSRSPGWMAEPSLHRGRGGPAAHPTERRRQA